MNWTPFSILHGLCHFTESVLKFSLWRSARSVSILEFPFSRLKTCLAAIVNGSTIIFRGNSSSTDSNVNMGIRDSRYVEGKESLQKRIIGCAGMLLALKY